MTDKTTKDLIWEGIFKNTHTKVIFHTSSHEATHEIWNPADRVVYRNIGRIISDSIYAYAEKNKIEIDRLWAL